MAVTATRAVQLSLSGDVEGVNTLEAANNGSSPGQVQITALASGANTITKPTGAVAVTVVPPAANIVTLTLKGVTGDTGVGLHLTDPTSIGLATGVTTFCLTASGTVTVRLFWS